MKKRRIALPGMHCLARSRIFQCLWKSTLQLELFLVCEISGEPLHEVCHSVKVKLPGEILILSVRVLRFSK